jgi:Hint domain-containing protein
MGYNISDVGGEATGGLSDWVATLDLSLSNATTISGDFDVVPIFGGSNSEATDGYTFSALSNPTLGSLVFNTVDGTYTFTVDWSAVIATGSDQVVSFDVTGTSGADSDTDTVTINLLICVARGTKIETTTGPKPVETLEQGDLVVTMDGPPQHVRWVGSRKITSAEISADPSLRPIRFSVDALGKGLPNQPLIVSPQHRVFLQDWRAQLMFGEEQVLVPAKSLVNDGTIRRDHDSDGVEYFHVLFDEHQIIFTDGLATESFFPAAYTLSELADPVREELFKLFPHLRKGSEYGSSARPALRPWEARMLKKAMLANAT